MPAIKMFNYEGNQKRAFETKQWATPEEMSRISSGNMQTDVIFGENASAAFFEQDKRWETSISNNVLAFGGTGSGKTESFILPNLLNHLNCNYVVTDTKGEILRRTGQGFVDDGYRLTVLDTINIDESAGYDPLRYVSSASDIPSVVAMVMDGLTPKRNAGRADPFWNETADMLVRGVVGILFQLECVDGAYAPGADDTQERRYLRMNNVTKLLELIKITDDRDTDCPLDRLVDALEAGTVSGGGLEPQRDSYGVRQYRDFRVAADRTLKSILISVNMCVSKLQTPELQRLFEHDELELDRIDEGKRFIDIKMSDNDSTYSWLGRIAIKQLFNLAQRKADSRANGRLLRRLEFVLDEFPNVGYITDFERSIATVRGRGISFLMCAQSLSQLDGVYGAAGAQIILDNCDAVIYMGGGSSVETARYISSLCGESVLGTDHVGAERTAVDVRGNVITAGEVSLLPRTDCLVKVTGMRPFRTKKFFRGNHPNAVRWLRP